MKKQVTLGLIALGLASGSALAGHPARDVLMPTATPVLVTVPEQIGSWSLGIEALYWQPTNSDFQYALTRSQAASGNATNNVFRTKEVESDYDWGFRLDGTYHLPVQGKDIEVSWVHFDENQVSKNGSAYRTGDDSVNAVNLPWDYLAPNLFPVDTQAIDTEEFDSIHAKSEYEYDHVDLLFGQKIQVGSRLRLHPFAGARWAEIDGKNTATAIFNAVLADDMSQRWRFSTDFEGVGPRLGMDGDIDLGYGFGVSIRAGFSLLVGQQKNDQIVAQNNASASEIEVLDHNVSSTIRLVPETDMKMGINYNHVFNQTWAIGLELGYEVSNYFDALDKSILGSFDSVGHSTDFGWNGPYARFQVNIA
ncbi:MAG: Lpg1974 family pore-forming outer membrane protein [Gammaproteobacteria bacterium]